MNSMPNEKKKGNPPFSWDDFCEARACYLSALADTVKQAVQRQDTRHPAFCGCIDWHSSVHGVYALCVVSRLTSDPTWAEIAETVLHPQKLEEELLSIQRGELNHELPYGYAWFLKLAQEWDRMAGKQDVLAIATELAERLERWIFSLSPEEVVRHAQNRAYGNLSWALLKLWNWSQWRNQRELEGRLSEFARHHLLPLDEHLPPSFDHVTDEFFPASLQRTRALLAILTPEETHSWLEEQSGDEHFLNPVQTPSSAHSAGLNFSRSWGYWDLYKRTGQLAYRELYVSHIVTHMELPQYWNEDYRRFSHWVPQFGVYAIALSMEDEQE